MRVPAGLDPASWMVRWKLLGHPKDLELAMFLTLPDEAAAWLWANSNLTSMGFGGRLYCHLPDRGAERIPVVAMLLQRGGGHFFLHLTEGEEERVPASGDLYEVLDRAVHICWKYINLEERERLHDVAMYVRERWLQKRLGR